jgi:hypothetical protein
MKAAKLKRTGAQKPVRRFPCRAGQSEATPHLQVIKDQSGRDEYVLLPVSLYRAFRDAVSATLADPVWRALRAAPLEDEEIRPGEEAAVQEARESLARGEGIPHQQVKRLLGL